jgi:hypothetical protein
MANELTVVAAEEYTLYEDLIIDIGLTLNDSFTGYQYDLVYDDTLIQCTNIQPGALMELNAFTSNNGDTVFGALLNEQAFTNSGTLNTVTFTSTGKTGIATIALENVMLIDNELNEVPVTVSPATILIDTAPTIEEIPDQTHEQGSGGFSYQVTTNDVDGDNVTLWCDTLPAGAEVDAASGTFRWNEPIVGEYTIAFLASDGHLFATESFVLTVVPAYMDYDINKDRCVDIMDLTMVANAFGTIGDREDCNGDGIVNIIDLTIVANNFGFGQLVTT